MVAMKSNRSPSMMEIVVDEDELFVIVVNVCLLMNAATKIVCTKLEQKS